MRDRSPKNLDWWVRRNDHAARSAIPKRSYGQFSITLPKAPYPVMTTVQVAALYRPELVVEITAVAEIPRDHFRRPSTKNPSADASF